MLARACGWASLRAEHAELVALGIGEHHPRDVGPLAHVGRRRTEVAQPGDLGPLVAVERRMAVEGDAGLPRLRLGDADDVEVRWPVAGAVERHAVLPPVPDRPS